MWKKLLLLALLGTAYYRWSQGSYVGLESPLALSLGFDAPLPGLQQGPLQQALDDSVPAFRFRNYSITPLASFQASARVLGAEHYRLGREAELSPVDLALGWGPMAEDNVLNALELRQSGRFFLWHAEYLPISRRDIETHSANMHMIPASPEIDRQLRRLRAGDIIRFRGYLVRVEATDGWQWRSSLSREDTGAGACELVLLEALL
jgi:hypothetical protein